MLRSLSQALFSAYAAMMFGVIVLLLFCPLLIIMPTLPLRRAIGRVAVHCWAFFCFMPIRIRGCEHLPKGPCIAVCNHASYLDGILLTAALPARFTFLVQHGAGEWPYVGLVIRRMSVSLVNRQSPRAAALATRMLLDRVRVGGESFAIFPEGTFRRAAELMPFHAGAFVIAARAGVPVLPAVMRGTRHILGEGAKRLRWHPIHVEFFPVLTARDASRESADALRESVREVILRACGEADGQIVRDAAVMPAGPL